MSAIRQCPHHVEGEGKSSSSPFPGLFLYYPSQRQLPPALSALIDALRLHR